MQGRKKLNKRLRPKTASERRLSHSEITGAKRISQHLSGPRTSEPSAKRDFRLRDCEQSTATAGCLSQRVLPQEAKSAKSNPLLLLAKCSDDGIEIQLPYYPAREKVVLTENKRLSVRHRCSGKRARLPRRESCSRRTHRGDPPQRFCLPRPRVVQPESRRPPYLPPTREVNRP